MVGGSYGPRNLNALAKHGRICFIAGDEAPDVTFNVRQIMLKRAVITGSTLRHRTPEDKGRVKQEIIDKVWPLIANGAFMPVIGAVFPMGDVAMAHAKLASGKYSGKIILQLR
jgi:NADPH:quinone reductase-like Zn-dependent oxidoreductase